MRRREVIGGLVATSVAAKTQAQSTGKVYRLGVLAQSEQAIATVRSIVVPELAKLSFVEGNNLTLDFRAGADQDLPKLADELLNARPDAMLTIASPPTRAAGGRTSTVPIVMFGGDDAIAEGFADTLARPGGNVTAVVIMSVQLEAKRLQLLLEAVPSARRIGVILYGGDEPLRKRQEEALRNSANALSLNLHFATARGPEDFPLAFAAFTVNDTQALLIGANARLFRHREELAGLALRAGLPTVCEWASMVRDGFLLGYGPDREGLYRTAALKLARLLQGAAPADLPVEQPTVFSLAINLRTARSLKLDIPPSLLARADEVIE
jgi:putative ABC transport system substrate-binding protein